MSPFCRQMSAPSPPLAKRSKGTQSWTLQILHLENTFPAAATSRKPQVLDSWRVWPENWALAWMGAWRRCMECVHSVGEGDCHGVWCNVLRYSSVPRGWKSLGLLLDRSRLNWPNLWCLFPRHRLTLFIGLKARQPSSAEFPSRTCDVSQWAMGELQNPGNLDWYFLQSIESRMFLDVRNFTVLCSTFKKKGIPRSTAFAFIDIPYILGKQENPRQMDVPFKLTLQI